MTWIDIILLIIIASLVIHGIIIGLVRSIFHIVGIILGYLLAINFSGSIGLPKFLAFLLIFVVAVVIVTILGRIISKLIHITPLGGIDRILGGLLGFLKGFIIAFVFLILLLLAKKSNRILYKSDIAHWVLKGGLTATQVLPQNWYNWIEEIVTKRELALMEHNKVQTIPYEDYHLPL